MILNQPKLECTMNERDLVEMAIQWVEGDDALCFPVSEADIRNVVRRVTEERKA